MNRTFTEQFVLRITPQAGAYLDEVMREGGYPSRAALMRAIIDDLMRDDLEAHAPEGSQTAAARGNGTTAGPDRGAIPVRKARGMIGRAA